MAKKKLSDELQAEVIKVAPQPEREKVVVEIGGVPTPIYRGEESDSDWAAIKARGVSETPDMPQVSIQNGRKAIIDPEGFSQDELKSTASKFGQADSGDYVVVAGSKEGEPAFVYPRKERETDEEWNARVAKLEKHPRYESRAGVANRKQMQAKAEAQDKQGEIDRIAEEVVRDPKTKQTAQFSDYDRGVMERMNEDDRRKFVRDRMKSKGNPVSESAPVGTAKREGGGTILGKFGDAVKSLVGGAVPEDGNPGDTQVPEGYGKVQVKPMSVPSGTVDPEMEPDPQVAMQGMSPLQKANYIGDMHGRDDLESIKGAVNSVDQTLGGIRSAAGEVLDPLSHSMNKGVGFTAGMVANGMAPGQKSAFGNAADPIDDAFQGAPPVQPPPPDGLQGMSASASVKLPGAGFDIAGVDPEAVDNYKRSVDNYHWAAQRAQEGLRVEGDNQKQAVRQAAEREALVQIEAQGMAKLASEAKLTGVKEAQRYQSAKLAVLSQAREAASNPVDPNRYWNNKNDGQKAASYIAAALFGFTGKGMEYLAQVQHSIDQDMRVQEGDRASRVQGLRDESIGLGEAGQQALQNGASVAEAHIIERQAKLEGLRSYLDTLGMQLKASDQVVRYQQMGAQLGQVAAGLDQQGVELSQQSANSMNQARYQRASLAQSAAIAQMKIDSKKDGAGEKLPQAQQGIIQAATAGLGALPALEEAIGNNDQSAITAVLDQLKKQIPGTDESNRASSAAVLNRIIFAGIDKSVINAADQEFLNGIQSDVGWKSLKKPGAMKTLRRLLTETRNSAINTARAVGQNAGTLQTTSAEQPGDSIDFTPGE